MSTISILATVVIRLASYGGGATIDGGDIGIATYRPGWESGVPKDVCRVTDDWIQETTGVPTPAAARRRSRFASWFRIIPQDVAENISAYSDSASDRELVFW